MSNIESDSTGKEGLTMADSEKELIARYMQIELYRLKNPDLSPEDQEEIQEIEDKLQLDREEILLKGKELLVQS